jgi:hypothetical protein
MLVPSSSKGGLLAAMLQRRHIIAGSLTYWGKEFKRKLEQRPVEFNTADPYSSVLP